MKRIKVKTMEDEQVILEVFPNLGTITATKLFIGLDIIKGNEAAAVNISRKQARKMRDWLNDFLGD